MNTLRIKSEFDKAKEYFSNCELCTTQNGDLFVKVALQPTPRQFYIVSIYFSENYPNKMPDVYTNPKIDSGPHRYKDGNICYLHPGKWNPGFHNLLFVIQRIVKWLNKYEVWKKTGSWPGAEIQH